MTRKAMTRSGARVTASRVVAGLALVAVVAAWPARVTTPAEVAAADPVPATAPAPAVPAEVDEAGPEFATPTTLDRAGRIVAPIEINGRGPFRFILDTGANRSAMSAATAARLGLVPEEGAEVSVHGITGSAVLPVVKVQSFRAGDLVFERQRLPVLPSAVFGGVDGILGIDCLQFARVEVDFELDSVTIRRSDGKRAPAGYLVVPARLRHGGLLLVDGKVGKVPVKAILDTGAERSLGNEALRAALAQRSREPDETTATTVIGATPQLAEGTSFVAPAIAVGGARLTNLTVTFSDLHVFKIWSLLDEPALLIGMDLLGTMQQFVVDYRRREFHFKTWESSDRPSNRRCIDTGCRIWIPGG
jgi:predicted aspartyl protease